MAANMLNRSDSWNRHAYPVQTSSVIPDLPTPPMEETPAAVRIPRNISALKEAKTTKTKGRTIVVCLDGTGDKFDNDNSNIVGLVSCLKKDDKSQETYYQAGIGTYSSSGLSSGFSAAMDMAVGSGLGLHVRDAYHFLMHSYKEGDKICIFGFSRGAYTARCLAGMVHKIGLLPPRNIAQIPFAYEFYKDDTLEGWKQSGEFKKTFCIDVNVYFLGVFDSVNSVGFIPRQLPLSSTPTSKSRFFRHAMALDEHRAKFKINRYQKKDFDDIAKLQVSPGSVITDALASALANGDASSSQVAENSAAKLPKKFMDADGDEIGFDAPESEYERLTGHPKPYDTDVQEVWFVGAHADVGGGAVANTERHKLSNIPLRWMIRQCFECNTGIMFRTKALAEVGLDVHTLWPKYQKLGVPAVGPSPSLIERYEAGLPPVHIRSNKLKPLDKTHMGEGLYDLKLYHEEEDEDEDGKRHAEWIPEQVEDYFDAMSPLNDQLVVARGWWILEAWPVEFEYQSSDKEDWVTRVGMNRGNYRPVPDAEPMLHWTVQQRINQMGYKINARVGRNSLWKIVS